MGLMGRFQNYSNVRETFRKIHALGKSVETQNYGIAPKVGQYAINANDTASEKAKGYDNE